MKKRTTLSDIAKATHTSVMTVSKALNDKPGVSAELRREIIETAAKMNYSPNTIARALRTKSYKTLGVICASFTVEGHSAPLDAIQQSARELGYSVIFATANSEPEKEKEVIASLAQRQIDGLILLSTSLVSKKDIEYINSFNIPTVSLLRNIRSPKIDSVVFDEQKAFYDLTSYMLDCGCKKVAFIAYRKNFCKLKQIGPLRMKGYVQALEERGIEFDRELVAYSTVDVNEGYEAALSLVERGVEFDALVCSCDEIAIGAINALQSRGYRVPEDVMVCGCDDIRYAPYLKVPLTTAEMPFAQIAEPGVRFLINRIETPDRKKQHMTIKCNIIVRDSTAHCVPQR